MPPGEFPQTQWSQLLELRDPESPLRQQLLDDLARKYWRPVYFYVRALRRLAADDAQDLTQQFFAMLLARRDLEKLSPERGSFRGFLRTAVRNFLIDADRMARARPRLFPFGEAEADWPDHAHLPPDEAFDRAWMRAVLGEAVTRLRAELLAEGRASHVAVFEAYCLEDGPDLTYDELGRREGLSQDEVRARLREARRRLRKILRGIVGEYLHPDEDLERELSFILRR